jgi:hypothetical protein
LLFAIEAGSAMAEVGILPFARITLQVCRVVLPRYRIFLKDVIRARWLQVMSHRPPFIRTRSEKRNAFWSAQACIGGNQRKVEDFWSSGKKGVGRISVKRMNLAHGENDLGCQGRLSWRKLDKCLRDPSLEAHVQFDATPFNEDSEFPDTDR